MSNLYEILGLSNNATDIQVEQAYRVHSGQLKNEQRLLSETENIKLRAIEEAYSVLSSPSRRERYDQKLKMASQPIHYEVVESRSNPWVKIAVLAVALTLGSFYFYHKQNAARIEQLKIEEAKAKAEAEKVQKLAAIEQAREEQARIWNQRMVEANRVRESEQARYEGQQIHPRIEQMEANRIRAIQQDDRQAQRDKQQEEQAAKARVQQQNAAMEGALSRPIGNNYGSKVTVIQNQPARTPYSSPQQR